MKNIEVLHSIGKVININFTKLYNEWLNIENTGYREWYENCPFKGKVNISDRNFLQRGAWYNKPEEVLNKLKTNFEYAKTYNNLFDVYYMDNKFIVFGFGIEVQILPSECIEIELYKDYDNITIQELTKALPYENIFGEQKSVVGVHQEGQVAFQNTTKKDLEQQKAEKEAEIAKIEADIRAQTEEIRRQAELKVQELKEKMGVMLQELELKKKEMEVQIFDLDNQLYMLRCLLGDSVKVVQLRKGKVAPLEQPIVLFQKLRYIDEDFAKISTLYGGVYENDQKVEEILATNNFMLEQFCPNDKCIVLLKASKDNITYIPDGKNGLEKYKILVGNRIAILLRNGENLYIVWTEQDRIIIKENFIYNKKDVEVAGIDVPKEVYYLDGYNRSEDGETIVNADYTNSKDMAWVQFHSRRFLLMILQGLTQFRKIVEFPEEVNFFAPNRYIVFSTADNAIADHRFGTLSDFMKKRNFITSIGDSVLPCKCIHGSIDVNNGWGRTRYGEDGYNGTEYCKQYCSYYKEMCTDEEVKTISDLISYKNLVDVIKYKSCAKEFEGCGYSICNNCEDCIEHSLKELGYYKIDGVRKEIAKEIFEKISEKLCSFTVDKLEGERYTDGYMQAISDIDKRIQQVAKEYGVKVK